MRESCWRRSPGPGGPAWSRTRSRPAPGLAAALCATTDSIAELALDRLIEVRLADRHLGRYRMHDLLRLYAAELAVGDAGRHDQLQTALRWYVSGADQVGRTMRGRVNST